jgi:hypothetical protein
MPGIPRGLLYDVASSCQMRVVGSIPRSGAREDLTRNSHSADFGVFREEIPESGTTGQADTREECEGFLEYDMQYHASHGRIVLNAVAAEVCAKCEGEGRIPAKNGGVDICDACGGRLGPISDLTTFCPHGTEFLLIRRGDFSGPLSPRRAA